MTINACSINRQSINALCRLYAPPSLTSSVSTYVATLFENQVVVPVVIGTFSGGPITSISIISGSLNGTGGTLAFTKDGGFSGNILFGGTVGTDLSAFTGAVRLQGVSNYVDISFTITVLEAPPAAGGGQQQHIANTAPMHLFRREREEVDFSQLEMPYIQVTVEFNGEMFSQTLEQKSTTDLALINVYDLTTPNEVSINISDIQIKRLK